MRENTATSAATGSLYERLGRAEGIATLVDDIIQAHIIKARFQPYREDPARLSEVKQHLCRFLGAGSGGAEEYTGRSMAEAHRGMNISEAEYMAALDDIMQTLERHGSVVETILEFVAGRPIPTPAVPRATGNGLSRREREVLVLIAGGKPNKKIATSLGIAVSTVERHVTNIYCKLDAHGRADATMRAVAMGLVSPGSHPATNGTHAQ